MFIILSYHQEPADDVLKQLSEWRAEVGEMGRDRVAPFEVVTRSQE